MKDIFRPLGEHAEAFLTVFGDLHIGNGFQKARFLAERAHILAAPNRFCAFNGDIANAATPGSVEIPTEQDLTNTDQFIEVIELLKPLAAAGRILAYNDGNHEARLFKAAGILRGAEICYNLGIVSAYAGSIDRTRSPLKEDEDRRAGEEPKRPKFTIERQYGVHLHMSLGRNAHDKPNHYTAYLTHGWGGGRTTGIGLNKLSDLPRIFPGCDFYFMSHLHRAAWAPGSYRHYDQRTKRGEWRLYHLVMTPSVKEWGGYEEGKALPPGGDVMVRVRMGGYARETGVEVA